MNINAIPHRVDPLLWKASANPAIPEKNCQKWLDLGFPRETLEKHPESVKFLLNTRIIFTILGYQNDGLQFDEDHIPLIKKEGEWVEVKEIAEEIEWSMDELSLCSKSKPNEEWVYTSMEGLVSRMEHDHVFPIHQLSDVEMKELLEHANQFFESTPDAHPDDKKTAVIQIFTTPRKNSPVDNWPILNKLMTQFVGHVSCRLITAKGEVYSFYYSKIKNENGHVGTDYGKVWMQDFEEFRNFDERIVTTIPVSSDQMDMHLEQLREYAKGYTSFNTAKQNCVKFALSFVKNSGYKIETSQKIGKIFYNMLPNFLKKSTNSDNRQNRFSLWINRITPECVKKALAATARAFQFVGMCTGRFFSNLLILMLGGARGIKAKKEAVPSEDIDSEELVYFDRLITSWRDLFTKDLGLHYNSFPLAQWQLQQASTAVHAYEGAPKLTILPPEDQQPMLDQLRKKYLINFGVSLPVEPD